jgi:hypothetical protein
VQAQLDESPHDLRWQRVQGLVERALAHGLCRDTDLLTYCGLGLPLGERFDEAALVRDAIARAASTGQPLSEALAAAPAAPGHAD